MLTVEQVKNNISNYKIENGIVINKSTNEQITAEDKILEIKSSVMAYKEAKEFYNKRLRGSPENPDVYINKALKVYGLNNEENDFLQNKVIREIIAKNGLVQIDYGGNDLLASEKFSFLCKPKKDYGLAVLNYIAHQKNIDISKLDVTIDLSDFAKNGVSKVNIKYDKRPYSLQNAKNKKAQSENSQTDKPLYQHPMANELNYLEQQKQKARQDNDEAAYDYAQSNIERIINNNQATISPEKWNQMTIDEQIAFIKLKINESKVLHDKDAFDYWTANLSNLQTQKLKAESSKDLTNDTKLDFSIMINQLRNQTMQISSEYNQMLSDGYIDNEEKAILIKRLNELSKNASTIKSAVANTKQEMIIDSTIELINQEITKMQKNAKNINENGRNI